MPIVNPLLRTMRTAMAGAMMFVWYLGPAMNASAATEEERAAAFSAQIQASMLALEDGDRDAPRDRWDPQYVVDTVGIDVGDLYNWVRGSVVWMPYRGILRGPEGVLMDRVGNSIDQSLLLAALLRMAGHDVRLAHATLPDATIDKFWSEWRAERAKADEIAPSSPASTTDAVSPDSRKEEVLTTADLYGIDRTSVAQILESTNTEAAELAVDMNARVLDQTWRLSGMLGPVDAAAVEGAILAEARRALADHWWVQLQDGGNWTDLDLLAPSGAPGEALAPAVDTFDVDTLPEAIEQRVVIRIVTEQLKNGALQESTILEQSVRPRDFVGKTIGFRHFPMAWPSEWPQVTPDGIQIKLRAALYSQTEWMPVLVAGDAVVGTAGIYDTGEIDPSPQPANPFMTMTVGMMGMVSKATDVLATGGDPEALLPEDPSLKDTRPARAEGEFVAEWLEYVIQVPGSEPRTVRRQVFDLIGPAARAGGDLSGFQMNTEKALDRSMAMLGESEIQILPGRLAPEFLGHLGALNAISNRPVLDELARDPFGKVPANYMELFSKLNGMPAALLTLASLRFDLNPLSDWVYVHRPSVVAQHTRLSRAGGGDFVGQIGLDIIENGIGIDPLAAGNAVLLRISQGVTDTNAEAVALRRLGKVSANAADAFAAVPLDGQDWRTLRSGDEAVVSTLGYGADLTARITSELASGNLVVVPASLAPGEDFSGWWRIDPATGATLGVGPSGHGQAMVEYALIIIIQTMMAAAQCALQASIIRAAEKTLEEKAKGADSGQATAAGAKAGYEQAKSDWTKNRNLCIAAGMAAGFNVMLAGFAINAVKTSGNKGYDGSKKGPNAKPRAPGATTSSAAPQARAPDFPSRTPTTPGIGPRGQPRTPTIPGTGPKGPPVPTIPGTGPKGPTQTTQGPKSPPSSPDKSTPNSNRARENADTVPVPQNPRDRFMDAQKRAQDAQDRMARHKPVDTPEGRAETDKLWRDLDQANRDRILAYDSMPRNQRPSSIPPVPPPASPGIDPMANTQRPPVDPAGGTQPSSVGPFGGYKTGDGPPSQMPPTQPAPGEFGGYKTGEGPPSQIPPTQAAPGQGPATKTGEAPPSSIPEIAPGNVPPAPTTTELLDGLGGRGHPQPGRPSKPGDPTPSADDLLSGLGNPGPSMSPKGNPVVSGVDPFAITQTPSLPPPPVPKTPNGNTGFAGPSSVSRADAAKTSGLAGLAGALETVTEQ